jgi:hypothetical protein
LQLRFQGLQIADGHVAAFDFEQSFGLQALGLSLRLFVYFTGIA